MHPSRGVPVNHTRILTNISLAKSHITYFIAELELGRRRRRLRFQLPSARARVPTGCAAAVDDLHAPCAHAGGSFFASITGTRSCCGLGASALGGVAARVGARHSFHCRGTKLRLWSI